MYVAAGHRRDRGMLAAIAAVALVMRLVPVLRGGGLYGDLSYDGSVYYAASAGLAHGLLPYRDFLVLHPPGIMLVLLPFAAIGRLLGDAQGLAAARVGFMLLGTANAVGVSRVLARDGRGAALVGGLGYAVFFPAIFMERSDSLEGVATFCLLACLLLLTRRPAARPTTARAMVLAGALLGFGAAVKIWGVVVALAVVLWCARALGRRAAVLVAAGSALGAGVVCVPFFAFAPTAMWQMVVRDQVGRPEATAGIGVRVADIVGLAGPGALPFRPPAALLVATLVVLLGCCLLACRTAVGRAAVVLLVSCAALLLATPTWFAHYAGLTAAPMALVVGSAASAVRGRRPLTRVLLAGVAGILLLAMVTVGLTRTFGTPFPTRQLASAAAAAPGCITTDDPTPLIESDLLHRNLDRGCPLVVDLGGYSYDLPSDGPRFPRSRHLVWQAYALRYLASGSVAIVGRFSDGTGFSASTAATVDRWPTVVSAGRYRLRRPPVVFVR